MADEFWERAARKDPLWAILSDPAKRDRQWDAASFFESGRREISLLEQRLKQLGRVPAKRRALDFGCGVGRLTQALAASFDEILGVDASPTMVRLAGELNRHPSKARYVLNTAPVLESIETASIDFLYSNIVLQHLEPARAIRYVADFMRVLAPGGICVFQLPSRKRTAPEMPPRPVGMPPDAYRADIRVIDGVPARMTTGAKAVAHVEVRNASPDAWPEAGIRLGNHWRDAAGQMVVQDDGRVALPRMADGSVRLELTVTAPSEPGQYICEIDLVHEGVCWFADRGSAAANIAVTVVAPDGLDVPAAPSPAGPRDVEYPDVYALLQPPGGDDISEFPMFGVSKAVVMELVRTGGCELFQIDEDARGGPEWESHIYYVAKSGA